MADRATEFPVAATETTGNVGATARPHASDDGRRDGISTGRLTEITGRLTEISIRLTVSTGNVGATFMSPGVRAQPHASSGGRRDGRSDGGRESLPAGPHPRTGRRETVIRVIKASARVTAESSERAIFAIRYDNFIHPCHETYNNHYDCKPIYHGNNSHGTAHAHSRRGREQVRAL